MENPAGIAKFSVMKKTSSRRNGSLAGKKFLAVIRIGYIKYQDIVQEQAAPETESEREPVWVLGLWDDVCQTNVFPGREVELVARPYSGRNGVAKLLLCWLACIPHRAWPGSK